MKSPQNFVFSVFCAIVSIFVGTWVWVGFSIGNRDGISPGLSSGAAWNDTDCGVWVLVAKHGHFSRQAIVRRVPGDVSLAGRPLHWSNIPSLGIRGIALFFGANPLDPRPGDGEKIEMAAMLWNPIVFCVFCIAAAFYLSRRCGWWGLPPLLFILFVSASISLVHPWQPDHHTLIIGLACVLFAAVFEGHKNERSAWALAGSAAGVLLWVSAINAIMLLVFCALSSLLAVFVLRSSADDISDGWRRASWWAGGASFLGWLVEYAPSIPTVVETNTPLHAMAVFGGFRAVSWCCMIVSSNRPAKWSFLLAFGPLAPLAFYTLYMGSAAAPSTDIYWMRFMWAIQEMQPHATIPWDLFAVPMIYAIAVAAGLDGATRYRSAAVFALAASGFFAAIAMHAVRMSYYPVFIPVILLPSVLFTMGIPRIVRILPTAAVAVILPVYLGLSSSSLSCLASGRTIPGSIDRYKNMSMVADAFLKSSPPKGSKILAFAPGDASLLLTFIQGHSVSGGIYWESADGVLAASSIAADADAQKVAEKVFNGGYTHCLLPNNSALGPAILSIHGRDAMLQAFGGAGLKYPVFGWSDPQKRPSWLLPIEGTTNLFKIIREELKKQLPDGGKLSLDKPVSRED